MQRAAIWSGRGSAAVDAGDLQAAKACFLEAVKADGHNASHRLHLAIVLEALGELAAAAEQLTEALRRDSRSVDATRRLVSLAGRIGFAGAARLDSIGLRAALKHDRIDREVLGQAVLRWLAQRKPLGDALAVGRTNGGMEAARRLCLVRTTPLLTDELFLDVLRSAINEQLEIELLLSALRSVLLLEVPATRFDDRGLWSFALALMQQCWSNEHVWSVSDTEAQRSASVPFDSASFLSGDIAAGRQFVLKSLYRPIAEILGADITARAAAGIRPKALRDIVTARLAEVEDERARRAGVVRVGTISDPTSRAVAKQYESNPYPRWVSLGIERDADFRRRLDSFFLPDRLRFLNAPFEVLVAGCGTGKQVVQALKYGANARLTAVDLSAAALAYASRMAEKFGMAEVAFVQADLQEFCLMRDMQSRFHVIECVGVLHHMDHPLQGWRTLLKALAPGGLIRIGVYSALARSDLMALRRDAAYPGAGCGKDALRAFREVLKARETERPTLLSRIADFYSTSEFRDLLLHVCEQGLTITDIQKFLHAEGLVFRGFHLPPEAVALFRTRFPDDPWPGRLENWAELEAADPRLFLAMYNLWCDRFQGGK
jgi:SAM-dependent methyltransferase